MNAVFQGDIYKKHAFDCPCSMTHAFPIGEAVIGPGALDALPALAGRLGLGKRALVVTDTILMDILGGRAVESWRAGGLDVTAHALPSPLLPDERALGSVLVAAGDDTDFLVALGGGSVTDVARFVATRLHKPYIPVLSAITMDGFFTDIALLLVGGMKSTLKTDPPAAILADMDVIAKAPPRMNAAGLGEMASKYAALADWYAGCLIKGELYCAEVERLVRDAVLEAFSASDGIVQGDASALGALTDALFRSGVSMYWYGSARPISGAEHHLSHYWVMRHAFRGLPPGMHGNEVGVGAVLVLNLWERLLAVDETAFDVDAAVDAMPTREQWEASVRRGYGEAAPEAFKAQRNKSFDKVARRAEIRAILAALPALREKFAGFLPGYKDLARQLKAAGAPFLPEQLHVTREELMSSVLYAKEARDKYTSLWIADALGLLPDMAKALADDAEALAAELA